MGCGARAYSQDLRRAIQAAFDMLYRSNLNVTQALEEVEKKFKQPEIAHLIAFVRSSKRGICKSEGGGRASEDEE